MNAISRSSVANVIAGALGLRMSDLGDRPEMYRTLGWDSLATIQIVEAIESRFNISFSDEELMECTSLDGVMKLLATKEVIDDENK